MHMHRQFCLCLSNTHACMFTCARKRTRTCTLANAHMQRGFRRLSVACLAEDISLEGGAEAELARQGELGRRRRTTRVELSLLNCGVRARARARTCAHAHEHTRERSNTNTHTHVYKHIRKHTRERTNTNTHTHVYKHICTLIHAHLYTHRHVLARARAHTHTHTRFQYLRRSALESHARTHARKNMDWAQVGLVRMALIEKLCKHF